MYFFLLFFNNYNYYDNNITLTFYENNIDFSNYSTNINEIAIYLPNFYSFNDSYSYKDKDFLKMQHQNIKAIINQEY